MMLPRRGDVIVVLRSKETGKKLCKVRFRKEDYCRIDEKARDMGYTFEQFVAMSLKQQ